jgi:acid stress-induced BolA-like protein IbaG/YrbA
MQPVEIETRIAAAFADAIVSVESEDNTHFGALVVAREFEGLRSIARHQLVYKSLGPLVGNEIHALSIQALTPGEWAERNRLRQD